MMKGMRTLVNKVKKSCERNGDFITDIKEYGLTIDDVAIVHQRTGKQGDVSWEVLQKGKEPRVRIIVEMVRGKLEATALHVTTLINGKRVGRPPMGKKAA